MSNVIKVDRDSISGASGSFDFEADGDAAIYSDSSVSHWYSRDVRWRCAGGSRIECTISVSKFIKGVIGASPEVSKYTVTVDADVDTIKGLGSDDSSVQQRLLDALAEDNPQFKAQNPKVK